MTAEDVTVDAFTADPIYALHCMYDGQDVTEGMSIAARQSATVEVYVDVLVKELFEGKMYVNTTAGNFEVNIVYETTLGIGESNTAFNLFPNPVSDVLTINGANLQNITVFNVLGQIIDEWTGNDSETHISTASYKNGIYFVRINGRKTMRFVVTH